MKTQLKLGHILISISIEYDYDNLKVCMMNVRAIRDTRTIPSETLFVGCDISLHIQVYTY